MMRARIERVPLRHVSAQVHSVKLREMLGSDELALGGVDTRSAVRLLDSLLEAAPCSAGEMSASDRDGLLAALHRTLWGDHIVSSLECIACGEMFDLSFDLSALQRKLFDEAEPARVDALRSLADSAGSRYTLPGAEDEERAAQLGLASGCAQLRASIAGKEMEAQDLNERLEALAPLLDVDLDTRCAECGHAQLARFDIQSFVLQRLLDERENVLSEVHAMASSYGWSLQEIVSLPRSMRRSLVQRLSATPSAFG